MNQVTQLVIQHLQGGILVIDKNGNIQQHNMCAERLLGSYGYINKVKLLKLFDYVPEIADKLSNWRGNGDIKSNLLRLEYSGVLVRPRLIPIHADLRRGFIIFLEDAGLKQAQLQQLKLAESGQLTANIAHEICNPLSAINHAAELLEEE